MTSRAKPEATQVDLDREYDHFRVVDGKNPPSEIAKSVSRFEKSFEDAYKKQIDKNQDRTSKQS